MSEKNNFLYDVSMSYVNAGWQERYCALVKYLDAYLKENCGEFFADLQLYQTGPMNYVVVAGGFFFLGGWGGCWRGSS